MLDLDLHMISSMQQYFESNFQFPPKKEEHLQKRKVIINRYEEWTQINISLFYPNLWFYSHKKTKALFYKNNVIKEINMWWERGEEYQPKCLFKKGFILKLVILAY